MKYYKLIILILIVFFKTGNILSDTNVFNVNNIEIEKKDKTTNEVLANLGIKKAFKELINKILLDDDKKKLRELKFSEIKELVNYYQISNKISDNQKLEKINFNISFDKKKIHNLFYTKNISYSEITNKELFILPILKKDKQVFVYNKNFFYDKWNEVYDTELIEFILPLENIEIIQNVNFNKNNLLNLELEDIFTEYSNKNLALILIEDNNLKEETIYLKIKILEKTIVKNIKLKRNNSNQEQLYKRIIAEVKKEIINLVKFQNLIDIRIPAFINVNFKINKKTNLVELNSRIKKIDLIENIYIKKFNNESIFLKIKYLGKLDKLIRQLKNQKIILKLIDNQWSIKII